MGGISLVGCMCEPPTCWRLRLGIAVLQDIQYVSQESASHKELIARSNNF
jgi:hypothetical protein